MGALIFQQRQVLNRVAVDGNDIRIGTGTYLTQFAFLLQQSGV